VDLLSGMTMHPLVPELLEFGVICKIFISFGLSLKDWSELLLLSLGWMPVSVLLGNGFEYFLGMSGVLSGETFTL